MKKLLYLLIPVIIVGCGPARNADGSEIGKKHVWARITAGKDHPHQKYTCPPKP